MPVSTSPSTSNELRFACAACLLIGALAIAMDAPAAADNDGASDAATSASGVAPPHPTPWPIRHWRHHQPRRGDLTPEEVQRIERLNMQIETENPALIAPAFRHK